MNIAMNEDFKIAYERSDEVLANIRVPRDSLVDVNKVLNYIRSSYFPELVVYSRSFAGIGSPATHAIHAVQWQDSVSRTGITML